MSLSVEHIKQVLGGFESCDLAVFDDTDSPCRGADRIVIDALRELIAIKEAEPVAEVVNLTAASYWLLPKANWKLSHGTQLIIKPE